MQKGTTEYVPYEAILSRKKCLKRAERNDWMIFYVDLNTGSNIGVEMHSTKIGTDKETIRNIYISEYHMY